MAFDVVFLQDFVRQEALQMLQNALDGSGGLGASAAYSEAFRIVMRLGVGDKSFIVRIAAARCLMTFATIGGPGLGVTEIENSATYCVKVRVPPKKNSATLNIHSILSFTWKSSTWHCCFGVC